MAEQDLFGQTPRKQSENPGESVCHHQESGKIPVNHSREEEMCFPGSPEIRDDGKHHAGVQHHKEQGHLRIAWIEVHEFCGYNNMGRTRDRKECGFPWTMERIRIFEKVIGLRDPGDDKLLDAKYD